jgi:MFS transporter, ACS family, glucarate transporter
MGQQDPADVRFQETQQTSAPTAPTGVRYWVLAAACILALIAYIHRVGFATAGTYFKQDLGLTDSDWGYVMAAFLVAYGAFEVPWGLLGDWLGARSLLTIMALGWSVLTAAIPLVVFQQSRPVLGLALTPFWFLLTVRFLFGVFQAGIFPAISRMMADWMPIEERGTSQGLVWTLSRLGGAVAPFVIGGMTAFLHSWQWCLVVVSGLGLVWCAIFYPWFRNKPAEMPQVNDAERLLIERGRAPQQAGHGDVPWKALFTSLSVWSLCLLYGFGGFSATFFITLLPSYLRDHRHLSEMQAQWVSGMPLACGIIACLGGGALSDWIIRRTGNRTWGRRLSGMVGHVCAGLFLLETIWVDNVWALGFFFAATFFCNDLGMGPAWAACADIGERYAGTVGGAMNMVGNLMAAAGSLMAGRLFHAGHTRLVFVIFACSFWVASLCWMGVDATKSLSSRRP